MKVAIVGGGPGGLYLSILMKRADPGHEITLVERNAPDATFGWGVVFSDDTLGELRDADYATYLTIEDNLVHWGGIDIHYRGRKVRAEGHGFSAISRKVLLSVLQQRAREVGVDLRFEHDVADLSEFDDHDVVVAADGVNSRIRAEREKVFGATLDEHASKFAWFGADRAFDAFTFIFRETEHGLFTVHAYPFDESTSTFIIECSRATWRSAGLDTMSEEDSLAWCQELFADDLDGHRLLSNRSLWISFLTVRNRNWHEGNLVLLGDAAHTAHFSIGSGTKLAMEDAIALSKAFVEHPEDLQAAFNAYELERQIPVERFQTAAVDSALYFENVARYLGFEHEPFVFNLLTRSGRITHHNVAQRDAVLANRVDRWFRAEATADPSQRERIVTPAPALAPLTLAGVTMPNRVVLAPPPLDAAEEGEVGDIHRDHLLADARAGAGLVVSEMTAVSAEGMVTRGSPGMFADRHMTAWERILSDVHDAGGVRLALRLGHAGRRGATRTRERFLDRPLKSGWPLLAPAALPYTPRSREPVAMETVHLDRVRDEFGIAAERAAGAGFDLLLLDASDGYLLASFLSPLTNPRDDDYGGDLAARMRFPLEVLDAVRALWPASRPLGVRLNCDDRVTGGLTPDDAVEVARALRDHGCDVIDAVSGHTVPRGGAEYRRGFQVTLADRVRNEAGIATIASGQVTTLDEIDTILAAGRADLCVLDPARYEREW